MKILNRIGLLLLLYISFSCTYEFPEIKEEYTIGDFDLSRFISFGDGYSAGQMDGSLYIDGQENSFPSILSNLLYFTTEITFHQPNINSINGFNTRESELPDIQGRWIYAYDNETQTEPSRILTMGELPVTFTGTLQAPGNFSVPFAKSFEMIHPMLSNNIYYERFASNPGTSTLLGDAINQNPSFISLWIGMHDFLEFAVAGGTGESDPGNDPLLISTKDLSPVEIFESALDSILSALFINQSIKGMIAQLPQFDDFPFFYIYQYNFITVSSSKLSACRAYYQPYNEAVTNHNINNPDNKRTYIDFNDNGSTLYPQEIVVQDETMVDAVYPDGITPLPKIRQLEKGELVLLSFPSEQIESGYGTIIPASEEYYLSFDKIEIIKQRIDAYNIIIENQVNKYPGRLHLVPLAGIIHDIAETGKFSAWGQPNSTDIKYINGVPLEGTLDLNSIFSLDGLQFNQRGNAFITNQFIEIMNNQYQANIPFADVNSYIGNTISIQ